MLSVPCISAADSPCRIKQAIRFHFQSPSSAVPMLRIISHSLLRNGHWKPPCQSPLFICLLETCFGFLLCCSLWWSSPQIAAKLLHHLSSEASPEICSAVLSKPSPRWYSGPLSLMLTNTTSVCWYFLPIYILCYPLSFVIYISCELFGAGTFCPVFI